MMAQKPCFHCGYAQYSPKRLLLLAHVSCFFSMAYLRFATDHHHLQGISADSTRLQPTTTSETAPSADFNKKGYTTPQAWSTGSETPFNVRAASLDRKMMVRATSCGVMAGVASVGRACRAWTGL